MSDMTTIGLSQMVSGPTHAAGHTLDLVFCAGWGDSDLTGEELLQFHCLGQITIWWGLDVLALRTSAGVEDRLRRSTSGG